MSFPPIPTLDASSIRQDRRANRPSHLNLVPKRSSSLLQPRKTSVSYLPSPPHTSTFPPSSRFDLFPIDEGNETSSSGDDIDDTSSECTLFREVALDDGLRSARPFRGMPANPEAMSHDELVRLTRTLYMDGMQLRRTVLQLSQQALYFKDKVDKLCEAGQKRRRKESCSSGSSE